LCLLKFGEYDVSEKKLEMWVKPSWVKGVERKVQKTDLRRNREIVSKLVEWASIEVKSWQYITVGGFSDAFKKTFIRRLLSPISFPSFGIIFHSTYFIHTHTRHCVFLLYDLNDENIFQSFFFIITLLNKTPSSDVWFQCCFSFLRCNSFLQVSSRSRKIINEGNFFYSIAGGEMFETKV
jgi:hypothetical protein